MKIEAKRLSDDVQVYEGEFLKEYRRYMLQIFKDFGENIQYGVRYFDFIKLNFTEKELYNLFVTEGNYSYYTGNMRTFKNLTSKEEKKKFISDYVKEQNNLMELYQNVELFLSNNAEKELFYINTLFDNKKKCIKRVKDVIKIDKYTITEGIKFEVQLDYIYEDKTIGRDSIRIKLSDDVLNSIEENWLFDLKNNININVLTHGEVVAFDLENITVYYATTKSFEKLKIYPTKKGLYFTAKPKKKRTYLPLEDICGNIGIDTVEIFKRHKLVNEFVSLENKNLTELKNKLENLSEVELKEIINFSNKLLTNRRKL